jgi:hypothetical protein
MPRPHSLSEDSHPVAWKANSYRRFLRAASLIRDRIAVPPFVTMLGPWPRRAIVLVLLAALGFAVVLLPWRIAARQPIFSPRGG